MVSIDRAPLFERLERCERVLVAGAGGGFDVFSGLPIYFRLRELGKRVWLANCSFTNLAEVDAERVSDDVVAVTVESTGPRDYFPEGHLATWLSHRDHEGLVYAFEKNGAIPLTAAYRTIVDRHAIDAIVLVDGGTDILMRGDEAGLGTPQEDITSLCAVHAQAVATKLVACVGFGVDRFHGVCHAHFLENVAALSKAGAYLGVSALLAEAPEVRALVEAVDFVNERMPRSPSIVANSVVSSVLGDYGDVHRTERTKGGELWINPLISLCWAFDLDAVARRCLYLDGIAKTRTIWDVNVVIEAFRHHGAPRRPWRDIPV